MFFTWVNIGIIDCFYSIFEMSIFFIALFGLCKLSFFKFDVDNTELKKLVTHRKKIAFNVMHFICDAFFFVITTMLWFYFIFQYFGPILAVEMELDIIEENINANYILSLYQNTITNFNFNTTVNFFVFFWQLIIISTTFIILIASYNFLDKNNRALMEFPIIVTLAVFFLCILISAADLFVVFMATIGFSLNTYVLILSNPDDKNCCESGIKYFYLSALSSGLIAFSLWLAYLMFLTLNFFDIEDTLKEWNIDFDWSLGLLSCFVCFLSFGFFFKLAAFPCHLWAAAVYEGSPQPIMAFFVLPIKAAVLTFFFKFFCIVMKDAYNLVSYLLWFSSLGSMLTGSFAALAEKHIRKLFAYSSINQMGFLLIGATASTANSLTASFNYLIIYIIMNCGLFIILLNTFAAKTQKQMQYLTDLTHFAKNNLKCVILLIIILFSMAGIPPLAGFFGKFYLMLEAITQQYYSLVVVGLFTTMLSTYYYLRLIKHLLFDNFIVTVIQYRTTISSSLSAVLITSAGFLIFYVLNTNFIYELSAATMCVMLTRKKKFQNIFGMYCSVLFLTIVLILFFDVNTSFADEIETDSKTLESTNKRDWTTCIIVAVVVVAAFVVGIHCIDIYLTTPPSTPTPSAPSTPLPIVPSTPSVPLPIVPSTIQSYLVSHVFPPIDQVLTPLEKYRLFYGQAPLLPGSVVPLTKQEFINTIQPIIKDWFTLLINDGFTPEEAGNRIYAIWDYSRGSGRRGAR